MVLMSHEQFMEKEGKANLEKKGFVVKDNLIDYDATASRSKKNKKVVSNGIRSNSKPRR